MEYNNVCPYQKKCGGCSYIGTEYSEQVREKRKKVSNLMKGLAATDPVIAMENPVHYRNKVTCSFGMDNKKHQTFGIYEQGSHKLVPVENCLIENEKASEIIADMRALFKSFKYKYYDENTGYGLIRHIMVRTADATGQIMAVIVASSPILPAKNNFVKALKAKHPELTTIVLNVNEKDTTFVLGERNITLHGPGFIEDILCGKRFRISPNSFYQINPVQTEALYGKAIRLAKLTGKETVIDAYCGIGTIGIVASDKAKQVIGIELNKDAVKDAIINKKLNKANNVTFINGDAGDVMEHMAANGQTADVVFMDPPRSGSTESFMDSIAILRPSRVVYVSCNPETLARDMEYFATVGYKAKTVTPVDMFPFTEHVETVVLMTRTK